MLANTLRDVSSVGLTCGVCFSTALDGEIAVPAGCPRIAAPAADSLSAALASHFSAFDDGSDHGATRGGLNPY